ncbi:unnamed protein product [Brassica oleracea]
MDLKPPLQNVIDGAAHPSINNSSSSISTQTTVTPDPRWPSKCRWSSPPASTSTLSTEVGDGEDMRHQIDAVDLELSPKDSSKILTGKKMGESHSGVEQELEADGNITSTEITSSENKIEKIVTAVESTLEVAGDNVTIPEITNQPEDDRNTCVPHSRSPQSTGLPPITTISPEISVDSPIAAFVPSIGAWAKPLAFAPPATPPAPATPSGLDPQYLNNLLDSFWPTLTEGLGPNQKKKKTHPSAVREFPRMPVQKIPVPELKGDGTLRFPWAARMDPATRNLYRAAKPTFRLDGTPQVTIPSQVLLLGPENKNEYIIGHFHRCSLPPGGLIHAVVNRLWGRTCRIGCRKLSDSSYMFHIPHDSTQQWVIQRAVWHVDDCLLFVSPWKSVNSFKIPEVSTIPVWVTLKNVPDSCYSRLGLSHVASGLGEPMQTHKPRLDPTCLGEAKLLVEVELDKPFPKQIALDDKQGNIFLVDVEYTWIPSVCGRCGHLGHKEKRCLLPAVQLNVEKSSTHEDSSAGKTQPEMEKALAQSNGPSDQLVLQAENLESGLVSAEEGREELTEVTLDLSLGHLQPFSVELKNLSTPVNNLTCSKVHIANGSNSLSTSSPLADTQSAPTKAPIMEEIPSPVIVLEASGVSADNSLVPPYSSVHDSPSVTQIACNEQDDERGYMSDATANLNMSRGGRPIKPLQKFQDMEWKTVREKGKRGRRGRGNYLPSS